MFRGIIYDGLLEQFRTTRPCSSEAGARKEANDKIIRMCNSYKVNVSDNRFYLESIEISK